MFWLIIFWFVTFVAVVMNYLLAARHLNLYLRATYPGIWQQVALSLGSGAMGHPVKVVQYAFNGGPQRDRELEARRNRVRSAVVVLAAWLVMYIVSFGLVFALFV